LRWLQFPTPSEKGIEKKYKEIKRLRQKIDVQKVHGRIDAVELYVNEWTTSDWGHTDGLPPRRGLTDIT
jgi:hypothetical protein